MKQHPPSAFIAGGKRKNKKIRIRGQKSKADNTLCIGVNNNIKVISVYKVTHSQAMCLLHHHKHITILVLHEIIFCIALLLPAMWFIPPPDTAQADAVSTKTRGNSGINGDQLRRRYENVKREIERQKEESCCLPKFEWIHAFQGEIEGCALSYGHFTDTLISCFSLSALSQPVCLIY